MLAKVKGLILKNSPEFPFLTTHRLLKFSKWTRALPFKLEAKGLVPGSNAVQIQFVALQGLDLFIWHLIALGSILNTILLWMDFSIYYPNYIKQKRISEGLLTLVWATCHLAVACHHTHFLVRRLAVVDVMNKVLSISTNLNIPGFDAKLRKVWQGLDQFSGFLGWNAVSSAFCPGILFLLFPSHRRYLYAFLPTGWQTTGTKLLQFWFECFLIACQWCSFLFSCILNLLYIQTLNCGFNALKECETLSTIKITQAYQVLAILKVNCDNGFGAFGLPMIKVSIGWALLLVVSVTIRLRNQMHPILTLMYYTMLISGFLILTVLIPKAGVMQHSSEDLLAQVKDRAGRGKSEGRAKSNSCRPIGISAFGFYTIKKETTLTFFSILLDNLINILVTLGEF